MMVGIDHAGGREGDEEVAVLDTAQAEERVGKLADRFGLAAEGDDLKAVVVADVDVEDGDDQLVMGVLEIGHPGGQFAGVVVIDDGQAAQNLAADGVGVDP